MTLRWNFHSTAVTVFPCGLGLGQKTEGGFGFDAIRTSEQLIQLVEVFLNVPFERHLAVFFFLIKIQEMVKVFFYLMKMQEMVKL